MPAERAKDWVVEAAQAHSNLNLYASIVSLLDGGHLYGANDETGCAAQLRIIRTCQSEQARWLRRYDRARKWAAKVAGDRS